MKNAIICFTVLLAFGFLGSCQLRIHPLYPYRLLNANDPSHQIDTVLSRFFYIEHFNRNNPAHIKAVERFAMQQLDSNYQRYAYYRMSFFHKTSELNDRFTNPENEDLSQHGKDLAIELTWWKGKYKGYHLYDDGTLINGLPIHEVPIKD
jgi:hypothetical protein